MIRQPKKSKKNDFTGICVIGVIGYKKYVLYSKSVKLSPRKLEQFIINVNDKFEPNEIVKEGNIEAKLTEDLKARGLPIEDVWTHNDKYTRLLGISGLIEVGDTYFLNKGQDNLIEQITNYPDTEHDDEQDAFVIGMTRAQQWIED